MGQPTRARLWLLLFAVIGCARREPQPMPSVPPVGEPPSPELRQRYSGTYVYAGGNTERAAVAAAVDRAVQPMSFLSRDIARSALMSRAEIRESITISFDDAGNVAVLSPGELPEVSPANGTPVRVTNRLGDDSELTQQFVDGRLVQRGRSDSGGGSTTFELEADGQTLLVRRIMESPRLPQPVKYRLTYKRK